MPKHLQTGSLKTINGQSLEGSGDIVISGTGGGTGLSELPAYSTNEVLTSERWTNGKPIYKKTINFGALPNNTTKTVAHNVSNMETYWVDVTNTFGARTGESLPVPLESGDTSAGANLYATPTSLIAKTTRDWSMYNCTATIKYTKTTDTALSPVALIGSTENITTDVEYIVHQIIDGKQVYGMRINCGALPNATIKTIDIPSYATSYTYWFKEGFALDPTTGDTRILPFVHYSAIANQVSLFLNQGTSNDVGTVQIITSIDYSSWNGIITLHYTK